MSGGYFWDHNGSSTPAFALTTGVSSELAVCALALVFSSGCLFLGPVRLVLAMTISCVGEEMSTMMK